MLRAVALSHFQEELVYDCRARDTLEWVLVVVAIRVDYDVAVWVATVNSTVVVCDDDLGAKRLGVLNRIEGDDPVVDSDDNVGLRELVAELVDRLGLHAVAINEAVRDEVLDLARLTGQDHSEFSQSADHGGSSTDAVGVIVAVNDDAFAGHDQLVDPPDELLRVLH